MTNTVLKAQIDSQITNETTPLGITPTKVGGNLKSIVDYVDQEIVVKKIKITLTAAQVQFLATTPIKVIEGVAGKYIFPVEMIAVANNVTTAYSTTGGQLSLRHEGSTVNVLLCNNTLNSLGSGEAYARSADSATRSGFTSVGTNIFVKLVSDPTGGDSGLVLYITYSIGSL